MLRALSHKFFPFLVWRSSIHRISLLSILGALLVGPLTAISMAQNIGASED